MLMIAKRIVSMLLAAALLIGMVPPVAVRAEESSADEVAETFETEAVPEKTVQTEETVTFAETEEQWQSITIAEDNETLINTVEGSQEPESAITGACGEALNWELSGDGILTISGSGAMTDYAAHEAPWYAYAGSITGLVLEEGITHIGTYAFIDCTGIAGDLVIPEGVISIGQSAFVRCSGLNGTLTLPDGLQEIGKNAFVDCTGITGNLVIPNTVTTIGDAAFSRCQGFSGTLTLSESLNSVGSSVFYQCSGLTGELVIPDSVSSISSLAFANCKFTSIVFGKGLSSIQAANNSNIPFDGCGTVTRVTFRGTTPPYAARGLFSGINNVKEVYVPADSYSSYVEAFADEYIPYARIYVTGAEGDFCIQDTVLVSYMGDGGEVTVPDGVTQIGAMAFYNCTGLTKLTLPESVTEIGDSAFKNCTGLTQVAWPSGLETIGNSAFEGCKNLTSVSLPESLTAIGTNAFYQCTSLTGMLTIGGSCTIGGSAFYQCTGLTGLELTGGITAIGAAAFYQCTGLTGDLILPNTVTEIGDGAFSGCTGFDGKLVLSESLTTLGTNAFLDCSGFTGELVIPDQVTQILKFTFSGMRGITSVVVGKSVSFVYTDSGSGYANSAHAFSGMSGVETVTFRNPTPPTYYSSSISMLRDMNVKTVYVPAEGYSAYAEKFSNRLTPVGAEGDFYISGTKLVCYCGDGGDVTIPEGVTTIEQAAFRQCAEVTSVIMPDSVTVINADAFAHCTGMTSVRLSENLKTIGAGAFRGCSGLTGDLVLPDSVTGIEVSAFSGCSGFTGTLDLTGVQYVEQYAFSGCSGFTGTLVIPEGISLIYPYTFQNCSGFTGLELGTVTDIREGAFAGCTGLRGDLVIPDSVTIIGQAAFSGCTGFDGNLKLSSNLVAVNQWAFEGCSGFTGELVVPDSVKYLYCGAFTGMSGITSLVLGEQISYIYTNKYLYNHSLGMEGVEMVTFRGKTLPSVNNDAGVFQFMPKLKWICVPKDAYDAYLIYQSQVADTVTFITDKLEMAVANLQIRHLLGKTVVLTWDPHTSEKVTGYTISCNGEVVKETAECSFTQRDLTTGTEYVYEIAGVTADGEQTSAVQVTVVPMAPSVTDLDVGNDLNRIGTENRITALVENNRNLEAFEETSPSAKLYYQQGEERILIGEGQRAENDADGSAVFSLHWDVTEVPDGEYTLVFCVTDADGVTGEYSEAFTVDKRVPEKIVGVSAVPDITRIHVNWGISAEADTTVYRIYRRTAGNSEFELLKQIEDRNTLSFADESVEKDIQYTYYVVGVNMFGQEGEPSETVSGILITDEEAPVVVTLTPKSGAVLAGVKEIAMRAEDNLAVVRSELQLSSDGGSTWITLAQAAADRCSVLLDTTAYPVRALMVRALAWDAMANESSPMVCTFQIDNRGPEKIQGLSYESTQVSATLRWEDVADPDISFFRVERKNIDGTYQTAADVYATLGVNLYDLAPDSSYTYRVVGYDCYGNRGDSSDDLEVRTQSDTAAPVITALMPDAGYYADAIELSATAEDEFAVCQIRLQVSVDTIVWTDICTKAYTADSKKQTLTYRLPLAGYAEGDLYIRAVAKDQAGNESDTGPAAPYVQYIVDRTAPSVPQNVKAEGKNGYIELSWERGGEADLGGYRLYRAESAEGEYLCVAENTESLGWIDRAAEEGVLYWYKIAAYDLAGNLGEASEPVSAERIRDTEQPKVVSVYPRTDSTIGSDFHVVSALVTDNGIVESVLIEYGKDGGMYSQLRKAEALDTNSATVTAQIPLEEFRQGEAVNIRVSAVDASGNVSRYSVSRYIVDKQAPAISDASAEYDQGKVCIRWTGGQEADLAGYRIYRRTAGTETWELAAQYGAEEDVTDCFCYDHNLPEEKGSYFYKIEAVDTCGNTAEFVTSVVGVPDRSGPKAVLSFDTVQEVDVEYIADASASADNSAVVSWLFDFGDGCTSQDRKAIHKYTQTGTYTVTLTVTDDDGNQTVVTQPVTVKERTTTGTVKVCVMDEHGSAVPGASVYFDLGEPTQVVKQTDGSGCAVFTAEAGRHAVGALIADNEWLPVKKDAIVIAGDETVLNMTMVRQAMVEGAFEVSRMTLEEIRDAGIDPTKPENQHIIQLRIRLQYAGQDINGVLTHNMLTNETEEKGFDLVDTGGGFRKIYPIVLTTDGPMIGLGEGPSGGGSSGEDEPGIDLTKVSMAYLDIPVQASFVKEFFNVNLHILNNASTDFKLLDNVVTLNIPEEIKIMGTGGTETGPVAKIPVIAGQSSRTLSWILRGDKAGTYDLSADYCGRVSEFGAAIRAHFQPKEPLVVHGISAVEVIAEVNKYMYYDAFYFNLGLKNVSDADVYLPSIGLEDDVINYYLKQVEEAHLGDDYELSSERIVRRVGTVLTNADGYSQTLKPETELTTLAPGETFTKKYAVDNVTGLDNWQYLYKAVAMLKDEGINCRIIETDMDLYSLDNALEKLQSFKGKDRSKRDMLLKVQNCQNYLYALDAFFSDTSYAKRYLEMYYGTGKLIFDFDWAYNKDEVRAITRELVRQLLIDESMQRAVRLNIETKYIKMAKYLCDVLTNVVEQKQASDNTPEEEKEDLKLIKEFLTSSQNGRKLAVALEKNREGSFEDATITVGYMVGNLSPVVMKALIADAINNWGLSEGWTKKVKEVCKPVGTVADILADSLDAWNEASEATAALIEISAAQEEARYLLDMLMENIEPKSVIYEELASIRKQLDTQLNSQMEEFAKRFAEVAVGKVGEVLAKAFMDTIKVSFHVADVGVTTSVATIYGIAKVLFGALDYVFDLEGTIEGMHIMRVCAQFGSALSQSVSKYGIGAETEEEAQYTLRALKYLIKMRLLGEDYFVDIYAGEKDKLAWAHDALNGKLFSEEGNGKNLYYSSFKEYLDALGDELITFRDNLYSNYYVELDIPAAPAVTINYAAETTNESFGSSYEYSYDGIRWDQATGEVIPLYPGVMTGRLQVRVKSQDGFSAGNIATLLIPARPMILGDIQVKHENGRYEITGLPAGSYSYCFAYDKKDCVLEHTVTASADGTAVIEEDLYWPYLVLGTEADEENFASSIRYLVPQIPEVSVSTEQLIRESLSDGVKEIRIDSDVTLTKDLTIPEGVTLIVSGDASLTVSSKCDLINHGTIQVSGSITIEGNFAGNPIQAEAESTVRAPEDSYIRKGQLAQLITISGEDTCAVGKSICLSARVMPGYTWDSSVVWRIASGDAFAKIHPQTGELIGLAAGEVVVRAEALDGSGTAAEKTVYITNYRVEIEADSTSLEANGKLVLTAKLMPTNYSDTKITWLLAGDGGQYASLSVNKKTGAATLTAKNVTEKQTVTVIAQTADDKAMADAVTINIYPLAQAVHVTTADKTDATGTQILFDLNRVMNGSPQRSLQLLAKVIPEEGEDYPVQWKSSDEKIAEVDDSGFVVFSGRTGTVKITAKALDGSKAAGMVTIKVVKLIQNVVMDKESVKELTGGKTETFTAFEADDNGSPAGKKLTSKQITWQLDEADAPYASITAAGKLTAKKVMEKVTVTLTGRIIGNEDRAFVTHKVTILPETAQIELFHGTDLVNGETLKLAKGDSLTLTATVYPTDAMNAVTWKSTNSKIASVKDGVVTPGTKTGTATITATAADDSGKKATVKVQVGTLVKTVTILTKDTALRSGKSLTLKAETDPKKPSVSGVTWSLVNPEDSAYVTLSSSGKLKAKTVYQQHDVKIIATSKDAAKVKSEPVTVSILPAADETLLLKQGTNSVTGQTISVDSLTENASVTLSAYLTKVLDGEGTTKAQNVTWKVTSGTATLSGTEGESVTVTQIGKSAVITASGKNSAGKTITAKVTLKSSALAQTITIAPKSAKEDMTIASGKTLQLAATVLAKNGAAPSSKSVTWSVVDGEEFAKLSSSGKLTAVKDLTSTKTVTVKATAKDGSGANADAVVTIRPLAQGVQVYTVENNAQTFSGDSNASWWVRSNTALEWNMEKDPELQLSAHVYPYYGEDAEGKPDAKNAIQKVSWDSSSTKIARVDETGKVTCVKPGSVTITATAADASGKKISFKLTVVKKMTNLELPETAFIAGGKSLTLKAVIGPTDTSNKKVTWSISGADAAYASISQKGVLKTGKVTAPKTVIVTATAQDGSGKTDSCTVTIYPATTKLTIQSEAKTLAVKGTLQLTAVGEPGNAAGAYEWKTSSAKIATVDQNGIVTGVKAGTVTITCTAKDNSGKKTTIKLKVTAQ